MTWHLVGAAVGGAWVSLIVFGVARGLWRERQWRRQGWRPVRHAALGRLVWAKRGPDITQRRSK
jgi:hypothetical protein